MVILRFRRAPVEMRAMEKFDKNEQFGLIALVVILNQVTICDKWLCARQLH
jgi:hypothetical protein